MIINIPVKCLSVNKAFTGRHFKTRDYIDFERDVCRVFKFAKQTIMGECLVVYTFYVSNYKMVDVDNQIKTTQDLLVKLDYIKDDRLIKEIRASKVACKKGEEKIIINIMEL